MNQFNKDHKTHIQVSLLGSGWAAVQLWWAPEHGGFWEPYQTGVGRYATKEEAIQEAKEWALAEEMEFIEDGKA